ncbi:uncharacterized protein LOC143251752 [Tachypleus tridentatus]|uniref:uncharacterized protein LOC143251752 n=1 Tax=Tachypleus tridentatus TaxID=6853 RepID=UPI003FD1C103
MLRGREDKNLPTHQHQVEETKNIEPRTGHVVHRRTERTARAEPGAIGGHHYHHYTDSISSRGSSQSRSQRRQVDLWSSSTPGNEALQICEHQETSSRSIGQNGLHVLSSRVSSTHNKRTHVFQGTSPLDRLLSGDHVINTSTHFDRHRWEERAKQRRPKGDNDEQTEYYGKRSKSSSAFIQDLSPSSSKENETKTLIANSETTRWQSRKESPTLTSGGTEIRPEDVANVKSYKPTIRHSRGSSKLITQENHSDMPEVQRSPEDKPKNSRITRTSEVTSLGQQRKSVQPVIEFTSKSTNITLPSRTPVISIKQVADHMHKNSDNVQTLQTKMIFPKQPNRKIKVLQRNPEQREKASQRSNERNLVREKSKSTSHLEREEFEDAPWLRNVLPQESSYQKSRNLSDYDIRQTFREGSITTGAKRKTLVKSETPSSAVLPQNSSTKSKTVSSEKLQRNSPNEAKTPSFADIPKEGSSYKARRGNFQSSKNSMDSNFSLKSESVLRCSEKTFEQYELFEGKRKIRRKITKSMDFSRVSSKSSINDEETRSKESEQERSPTEETILDTKVHNDRFTHYATAEAERIPIVKEIENRNVSEIFQTDNWESRTLGKYKGVDSSAIYIKQLRQSFLPFGKETNIQAKPRSQKLNDRHNNKTQSTEIIRNTKENPQEDYSTERLSDVGVCHVTTEREQKHKLERKTLEHVGLKRSISTTRKNGEDRLESRCDEKRKKEYHLINVGSCNLPPAVDTETTREIGTNTVVSAFRKKINSNQKPVRSELIDTMTSRQKKNFDWENYDKKLRSMLMNKEDEKESITLNVYKHSNKSLEDTCAPSTKPKLSASIIIKPPDGALIQKERPSIDKAVKIHSRSTKKREFSENKDTHCVPYSRTFLEDLGSCEKPDSDDVNKAHFDGYHQVYWKKNDTLKNNHFSFNDDFIKDLTKVSGHDDPNYDEIPVGTVNQDYPNEIYQKEAIFRQGRKASDQLTIRENDIDGEEFVCGPVWLQREERDWETFEQRQRLKYSKHETLKSGGVQQHLVYSERETLKSSDVQKHLMYSERETVESSGVQQHLMNSERETVECSDVQQHMMFSERETIKSSDAQQSSMDSQREVVESSDVQKQTQRNTFDWPKVVGIRIYSARLEEQTPHQTDTADTINHVVNDTAHRVTESLLSQVEIASSDNPVWRDDNYNTPSLPDQTPNEEGHSVWRDKPLSSSRDNENKSTQISGVHGATSSKRNDKDEKISDWKKTDDQIALFWGRGKGDNIGKCLNMDDSVQYEICTTGSRQARELLNEDELPLKLSCLEQLGQDLNDETRSRACPAIIYNSLEEKNAPEEALTKKNVWFNSGKRLEKTFTSNRKPRSRERSSTTVVGWNPVSSTGTTLQEFQQIKEDLERYRLNQSCQLPESEVVIPVPTRYRVSACAMNDNRVDVTFPLRSTASIVSFKHKGTWRHSLKRSGDRINLSNSQVLKQNLRCNGTGSDFIPKQVKTGYDGLNSNINLPSNTRNVALSLTGERSVSRETEQLRYPSYVTVTSTYNDRSEVADIFQMNKNLSSEELQRFSDVDDKELKSVEWVRLAEARQQREIDWSTLENQHMPTSTPAHWLDNIHLKNTQTTIDSIPKTLNYVKLRHAQEVGKENFSHQNFDKRSEWHQALLHQEMIREKEYEDETKVFTRLERCNYVAPPSDNESHLEQSKNQTRKLEVILDLVETWCPIEKTTSELDNSFKDDYQYKSNFKVEGIEINSYPEAQKSEDRTVPGVVDTDVNSYPETQKPEDRTVSKLEDIKLKSLSKVECAYVPAMETVEAETSLKLYNKKLQEQLVSSESKTYSQSSRHSSKASQTSNSGEQKPFNPIFSSRKLLVLREYENKSNNLTEKSKVQEKSETILKHHPSENEFQKLLESKDRQECLSDISEVPESKMELKYQRECLSDKQEVFECRMELKDGQECLSDTSEVPESKIESKYGQGYFLRIPEISESKVASKDEYKCFSDTSVVPEIKMEPKDKHVYISKVTKSPELQTFEEIQQRGVEEDYDQQVLDIPLNEKTKHHFHMGENAGHQMRLVEMNYRPLKGDFRQPKRSYGSRSMDDVMQELKEKCSVSTLSSQDLLDPTWLEGKSKQMTEKKKKRLEKTLEQESLNLLEHFSTTPAGPKTLISDLTRRPVTPTFLTPQNDYHEPEFSVVRSKLKRVLPIQPQYAEVSDPLGWIFQRKKKRVQAVDWDNLAWKKYDELKSSTPSVEYKEMMFHASPRFSSTAIHYVDASSDLSSTVAYYIDFCKYIELDSTRRTLGGSLEGAEAIQTTIYHSVQSYKNSLTFHMKPETLPLNHENVLFIPCLKWRSLSNIRVNNGLDVDVKNEMTNTVDNDHIVTVHQRLPLSTSGFVFPQVHSPLVTNSCQPFVESSQRLTEHAVEKMNLVEFSSLVVVENHVHYELCTLDNSNKQDYSEVYNFEERLVCDELVQLVKSRNIITPMFVSRCINVMPEDWCMDYFQDHKWVFDYKFFHIIHYSRSKLHLTERQVALSRIITQMGESITVSSELKNMMMDCDLDMLIHPLHPCVEQETPFGDHNCEVFILELPEPVQTLSPSFNDCLKRSFQTSQRMILENIVVSSETPILVKQVQSSLNRPFTINKEETHEEKQNDDNTYSKCLFTAMTETTFVLQIAITSIIPDEGLYSLTFTSQSYFTSSSVSSMSVTHLFNLPLCVTCVLTQTDLVEFWIIKDHSIVFPIWTEPHRGMLQIVEVPKYKVELTWECQPYYITAAAWARPYEGLEVGELMHHWAKRLWTTLSYPFAIRDWTQPHCSLIIVETAENWANVIWKTGLCSSVLPVWTLAREELFDTSDICTTYCTSKEDSQQLSRLELQISQVRNLYSHFNVFRKEIVKHRRQSDSILKVSGANQQEKLRKNDDSVEWFHVSKGSRERRNYLRNNELTSSNLLKYSSITPPKQVLVSHSTQPLTPSYSKNNYHNLVSEPEFCSVRARLRRVVPKAQRTITLEGQQSPAWFIQNIGRRRNIDWDQLDQPVTKDSLQPDWVGKSQVKKLQSTSEQSECFFTNNKANRDYQPLPRDEGKITVDAYDSTTPIVQNFSDLTVTSRDKQPITQDWKKNDDKKSSIPPIFHTEKEFITRPYSPKLPSTVYYLIGVNKQVQIEETLNDMDTSERTIYHSVQSYKNSLTFHMKPETLPLNHENVLFIPCLKWRSLSKIRVTNGLDVDVKNEMTNTVDNDHIVTVHQRLPLSTSGFVFPQVHSPLVTNSCQSFVEFSQRLTEHAVEKMNLVEFSSLVVVENHVNYVLCTLDSSNKQDYSEVYNSEERLVCDELVQFVKSRNIITPRYVSTCIESLSEDQSVLYFQGHQWIAGYKPSLTIHKSTSELHFVQLQVALRCITFPVNDSVTTCCKPEVISYNSVWLVEQYLLSATQEIFQSHVSCKVFVRCLQNNVQSARRLFSEHFLMIHETSQIRLLEGVNVSSEEEMFSKKMRGLWKPILIVPEIPICMKVSSPMAAKATKIVVLNTTNTSNISYETLWSLDVFRVRLPFTEKSLKILSPLYTPCIPLVVKYTLIDIGLRVTQLTLKPETQFTPDVTWIQKGKEVLQILEIPEHWPQLIWESEPYSSADFLWTKPHKEILQIVETQHWPQMFWKSEPYSTANLVWTQPHKEILDIVKTQQHWPELIWESEPYSTAYFLWTQPLKEVIHIVETPQHWPELIWVSEPYSSADLLWAQPYKEVLHIVDEQKHWPELIWESEPYSSADLLWAQHHREVLHIVKLQQHWLMETYLHLAQPQKEVLNIVEILQQWPELIWESEPYSSADLLWAQPQKEVLQIVEIPQHWPELIWTSDPYSTAILLWTQPDKEILDIVETRHHWPELIWESEPYSTAFLHLAQPQKEVLDIVEILQQWPELIWESEPYSSAGLLWAQPHKEVLDIVQTQQHWPELIWESEPYSTAYFLWTQPDKEVLNIVETQQHWPELIWESEPYSTANLLWTQPHNEVLDIVEMPQHWPELIWASDPYFTAILLWTQLDKEILDIVETRHHWPQMIWESEPYSTAYLHLAQPQKEVLDIVEILQQWAELIWESEPYSSADLLWAQPHREVLHIVKPQQHWPELIWESEPYSTANFLWTQPDKQVLDIVETQQHWPELIWTSDPYSTAILLWTQPDKEILDIVETQQHWPQVIWESEPYYIANLVWTQPHKEILHIVETQQHWPELIWASDPYFTAILLWTQLDKEILDIVETRHHWPQMVWESEPYSTAYLHLAQPQKEVLDIVEILQQWAEFIWESEQYSSADLLWTQPHKEILHIVDEQKHWPELIWESEPYSSADLLWAQPHREVLHIVKPQQHWPELIWESEPYSTANLLWTQPHNEVLDIVEMPQHWPELIWASDPYFTAILLWTQLDKEILDIVETRHHWPQMIWESEPYSTAYLHLAQPQKEVLDIVEILQQWAELIWESEPYSSADLLWAQPHREVLHIVKPQQHWPELVWESEPYSTAYLHLAQPQKEVLDIVEILQQWAELIWESEPYSSADLLWAQPHKEVLDIVQTQQHWPELIWESEPYSTAYFLWTQPLKEVIHIVETPQHWPELIWESEPYFTANLLWTQPDKEVLDIVETQQHWPQVIWESEPYYIANLVWTQPHKEILHIVETQQHWPELIWASDPYFTAILLWTQLDKEILDIVETRHHWPQMVWESEPYSTAYLHLAQPQKEVLDIVEILQQWAEFIWESEQYSSADLLWTQPHKEILHIVDEQKHWPELIWESEPYSSADLLWAQPHREVLHIVKPQQHWPELIWESEPYSTANLLWTQPQNEVLDIVEIPQHWPELIWASVPYSTAILLWTQPDKEILDIVETRHHWPELIWESEPYFTAFLHLAQPHKEVLDIVEIPQHWPELIWESVPYSTANLLWIQPDKEILNIVETQQHWPELIWESEPYLMAHLSWTQPQEEILDIVETHQHWPQVVWECEPYFTSNLLWTQPHNEVLDTVEILQHWPELIWEIEPYSLADLLWAQPHKEVLDITETQQHWPELICESEPYSTANLLWTQPQNEVLDIVEIPQHWPELIWESVPYSTANLLWIQPDKEILNIVETQQHWPELIWESEPYLMAHLSWTQPQEEVLDIVETLQHWPQVVWECEPYSTSNLLWTQPHKEVLDTVEILQHWPELIWEIEPYSLADLLWAQPHKEVLDITETQQHWPELICESEPYSTAILLWTQPDKEILDIVETRHHWPELIWESEPYFTAFLHLAQPHKEVLDIVEILQQWPELIWKSEPYSSANLLWAQPHKEVLQIVQTQQHWPELNWESEPYFTTDLLWTQPDKEILDIVETQQHWPQMVWECEPYPTADLLYTQPNKETLDIVATRQHWPEFIWESSPYLRADLSWVQPHKEILGIVETQQLWPELIWESEPYSSADLLWAQPHNEVLDIVDIPHYWPELIWESEPYSSANLLWAQPHKEVLQILQTQQHWPELIWESEPYFTADLLWTQPVKEILDIVETQQHWPQMVWECEPYPTADLLWTQPNKETLDIVETRQHWPEFIWESSLYLRAVLSWIQPHREILDIVETQQLWPELIWESEAYAKANFLWTQPHNEVLHIVDVLQYWPNVIWESESYSTNALHECIKQLKLRRWDLQLAPVREYNTLDRSCKMTGLEKFDRFETFRSLYADAVLALVHPSLKSLIVFDPLVFETSLNAFKKDLKELSEISICLLNEESSFLLCSFIETDETISVMKMGFTPSDSGKVLYHLIPFISILSQYLESNIATSVFVVIPQILCHRAFFGTPGCQ